MVTMSTVGTREHNIWNVCDVCVLGYGDIYCKTILGKVSCLLFIIGGLVSCAPFISCMFPVFACACRGLLCIYGAISTLNWYYGNFCPSWKTPGTCLHFQARFQCPTGTASTFSWSQCQQVVVGLESNRVTICLI